MRRHTVSTKLIKARIKKPNNDSRQNNKVGTGRIKCTYCNLTNHTVDTCFKKQRDIKAGIAVVKGKFIPERLKQYVHKATIAGSKEGKVKEVAVYRDTGAWQTLMLSSALPEKDKTATGSYAIIGGIGEKAMSVPIHKIWITGEYVSGEVEIGIVDKLPLEGVDILLGNDLTDSCCHKKCSPSLQVSTKPVEITQTPSEQTDLYPACVTTRSMSKAKVIEDDSNLDDTWLSTKFNKEDETNETPREVIKPQNLAKTKPAAKWALKESAEEINSKVDWNSQSLRKAQQLDQTLILPIITAIINKSLQSATVPDCFKTTIVTPLLKKPSLDPDGRGNYHPVSKAQFSVKIA